ncbi:MAG: nucleotidyltransferase [Firmicutes bacterium]|nr:nucleotidyltransferase [Bacillota bacterium]
MKVLGIIAEYNPFHFGHLYQIKKAKQLSGCDYTVAVMSGNFVQRGEPAICDKWSRAKMALLCGIDLVIELPVCYSTQSAEYFAAGGVKLLSSIGVDFVGFGAENDNINELATAAKILSKESDEFKEQLSKNLKSGANFPKAREEAAALFGVNNVLSSPNNILGVEYIKAIYKNSLDITPIAVKRKGSMHDGGGSALFIRNNIKQAKKHMPAKAYEVFKDEFAKGKAPITLDRLEIAAMSCLRLIPTNKLANISGISEGLENRIKRAAHMHGTINEVLAEIKTKRYVHSRLRRIIINCLLGITHSDVKEPPKYIRVLGLNEKGRRILAKTKEKSSIPIITKVADAKKSNMLQLDISATNLYSLAYPNRAARLGNLDYLTSPVYIGSVYDRSVYDSGE